MSSFLLLPLFILVSFILLSFSSFPLSPSHLASPFPFPRSFPLFFFIDFFFFLSLVLFFPFLLLLHVAGKGELLVLEAETLSCSNSLPSISRSLSCKHVFFSVEQSRFLYPGTTFFCPRFPSATPRGPTPSPPPPGLRRRPHCLLEPSLLSFVVGAKRNATPTPTRPHAHPHARYYVTAR